MIDYFIIFSRTGLVLFTYSVTGTLKGDPVSFFINNVLMEGRSGETTWFHNQYGIRWLLDNELGLVFAAIFHKLITPTYLDALLDEVSAYFIKYHGDELPAATKKIDFKQAFESILNRVEKTGVRGKPSKSRVGSSQEHSIQSQAKSSPKKKRSKKKKRTWDNSKKKISQEEIDELNKFGNSTKIENDNHGKEFLPAKGEKLELEESEEETDSEIEISYFSNFFKKISGKKPLDEKDLDNGLQKMRSHLLAKNVAASVTDELLLDVKRSLLGKKLNSFTKGANYAIREAIKHSVSKILTSKRSTDVLSQISSWTGNKFPFTIVFIGVNGVGKSTSLAKICFYLKSNGLKVLICACDTFRSGAVEQLKVHARNLKVEVFDSGYGKDPASVAMSGRMYAKDNGFDVVLVDTAGRMQNNVPLMREIAKLVSVNKPNLTLFVGEAIVGNDGINQLQEFNKFLKNTNKACGVDGMILTKFDTIDDKVGAAVSMVHQSGQPIFFVGTGQKYTNLNKLNVTRVVNALLKY